MRRRHLIGMAGAMLTRLGSAHAQQLATEARRIGILQPQSASGAAPILDALRQDLHELGWREGRNIWLERRYANGAIDRLPALARDLVKQGIDLIVAGSNPGVMAARRATRTLPIVMVTTGDPVAGGLVDSLRKPGGNVTGVTTVGQELGAKQLQFLRELMPGTRRIALLVNPESPYAATFAREIIRAATLMDIDLLMLEARRADQLDAAFATMRNGDAMALFVLSDVMFITQRAQIVRLAEIGRMPAVYADHSFVEAGGLMFYGAALMDMYRHAASYVDRILKGGVPAEMPVEQPTRFTLAINLRAARTLGLVVPPALLARADKVIE
jgi:putative ABC transport system substrate-binding protein